MKIHEHCHIHQFFKTIFFKFVFSHSLNFRHEICNDTKGHLKVNIIYKKFPLQVFMVTIIVWFQICIISYSCIFEFKNH